MRFLRNNRGFSLVEILTSVVILGLVATVFFQSFIFSQKTTTGNQEKLVALNVAQMVLERFKIHCAYQNITAPGTYTEVENINGVDYEIEIVIPTEYETGMGLHLAEITVKAKGGKIQSTVEGFVELCSEES